MINQCAVFFSDPLPHHAFCTFYNLSYFIQLIKQNFNISIDDVQAVAKMPLVTVIYTEKFPLARKSLFL
jgi:hypothetical protein